MIEVLVVVEGKTEQLFVNDQLALALAPQGVFVRARLLGSPGHKGGNLDPQRLLKDVTTILKQRRGLVCTTMFDFYGLPGDFPGKSEIGPAMSSQQKAECIESHLSASVNSRMSERFDPRRFKPYVQMHEFEALLFSAPALLAKALPEMPVPPGALQTVRDEFATPEEINEKWDSAPSRRILRLVPDYQKAIHGPVAAGAIGLECMRHECTHFNAWVTALESLGQNKV
jgi:hypothetical protein